jgi:Carbohydrate-selective porin, OprB family/S-layer homology domain
MQNMQNMQNKCYASLLVGLNILVSALIIGATQKVVIANAQINISTEKKKSEITQVSQKITPVSQLSDLQPQQPRVNNQQSTSKSQQLTEVTSVSQLSDVQPDDWSFRALQSLIERYGCIEGYPDNTFRGNRAINRYEFAAALNACMNKATQMVEKIREDFATQEELEALRRLQEEFAKELAQLKPRLEPLQEQIEALEKKPSFSTHSQLLGRAIFGISAVGGNEVNNSNIIFSHRTELSIDTSFGEKDRLRIRLAARNTPRFGRITGTDMANLSFAGDNRNDLEVTQVSYQFRPIKKLQVFLAADGGSLTSSANTMNAPINSSAIGNISKFSDESAIYDLGGSTGFGMEYRFNSAVRLTLGYMAGGKPNDPQQGIAGGAYGAIAQLTLEPTKTWSLGLTYVHAYNTIDTGKGSEFANEPFEDAAASANAYGIQTSWRLNKALTLSGWVGLIDATAESEPYKGSRASILTWATTLAVNDVGGNGNMLGLVFGQPPKVISSDVADRKDPDTALHFEAFYRYRLTDNLFITPGFFVIFNPEHNAGNDPVYVGTIRKTFLF